MCAKRSGVVKRLKARKAHLLKLLNSGKAIKWNDSVKISERKNQTTATDTSTYPVITYIRIHFIIYIVVLFIGHS